MKESTAMAVSKDMLEYMKDDKGFADHIVSMLSRELADRLIQILDSEGEVIVKQSDMRVSEVLELNQVEYRRFLNWEHLVRCKDCVHRDGEDGQCPLQSTGDPYLDEYPQNDFFCAYGERRE